MECKVGIKNNGVTYEEGFNRDIVECKDRFTVCPVWTSVQI